jgi:C-terminal processing protease CtpA/Prc
MIQHLDTLSGPEDRRLAIEAISASLAAQGTDQALDWVESLADVEERDTGMQAVYQNTPKGIGAVLKLESGFPKISDIMPTGGLASTDLREGDLIVQAKDSGKDPHNLYGRNMQDIVGLLRGTPGSGVEIRVLREN